MIVEVPGIGNVEFPDGTSPEVIERALAQYAKPTPQQAMRDRIAAAKAGTLQMQPGSADRAAAADMQAETAMRDPGVGMSILSGLAQGATLGFGDEIVAGLSAATSGKTYDQSLKILRDLHDNAKFARPVTTAASEIAGGAATSLAAAPATVGTATTLAGKAAMGAGMGAVEGGAYGFGTGEGGFANRASDGAYGAAFGGLAGGLAPVAIAGAGMAGRAISNPIASALNIPSDVRASRAFQTYLERSGMTADEVQAALDAAGREGQPMFMAADALGNTGQRALAGIARQPGNAREEIARLLNTRQDGQGGRIAGFLSEALDAPDTASQRAATLTAARDATADAAYTAARGNAAPVDVRGALGVIDARLAPMQGMGVADDGIAGKLAKYRNRLAAPNPQAPYTSVELSDFDRVLMLKQEIGDDIGAAVRAGRNNEARELGKVKDALDTALEGSSSAYRSANDGFAAGSRAIDAVDAGRAATSSRVRAEDTVGRFNSMPPDQQSAFRAGYADPLIARIDASAPGVNKARPLMADKPTAELGTIANNPDLLGRRIGRENTMFETRAAALGGSKTADNQADQLDALGLSASSVANALSGGVKGLAIAGVDRLLAGASGTNPATREKIAQMLLSRDPKAALAPAIKAAAKSGKVNDALSAMIRSALRVTAQ